MYLLKEPMNKEKNFTHYNADDFLHDSYFLAWMRNEDEQVNAFWQEWQKEHPEKARAINEAKEYYLTLISFDRVEHVPGMKEEVWQQIDHHIEDITHHHRKKIFRIRMLELAAVVALLFAGGWLRYKYNIRKCTEQFIVIQSGNNQKEILLADSSTILLDSYTTLKYHADNGREFWLDGQALFNIKHQRTENNGAVPFTVHAGIENITVLGTSFTVKRIDSTARVILVSGKVKASVGKRAIIMKPGEKAEWRNNAFSSVQVDPQLYLAWKSGEFHFNHTSLQELSELIKDYYGYELVVKNKKDLEDKTISGTVTARNEDILWKTLAVMFHAKVARKGTEIILTINK
jgi:ferric-dicitrate binding protein FerR (iron transport regulator)